MKNDNKCIQLSSRRIENWELFQDDVHSNDDAETIKENEWKINSLWYSNRSAFALKILFNANKQNLWCIKNLKQIEEVALRKLLKN